MSDKSLLALNIQRRAIALAFFRGLRLEFAEVHELSSDEEAATRNAEAFLRWSLRRFEVTTVALEEELEQNTGTRRASLRSHLVDLLRAEAISVWEEKKPEVLAAFGEPSARTRKELRGIARALWPEALSDVSPAAEIDAVALGYHVQTVREFMT